MQAAQKHVAVGIECKVVLKKSHYGRIDEYCDALEDTVYGQPTGHLVSWKKLIYHAHHLGLSAH